MALNNWEKILVPTDCNKHFIMSGPMFDQFFYPNLPDNVRQEIDGNPLGETYYHLFRAVDMDANPPIPYSFRLHFRIRSPTQVDRHVKFEWIRYSRNRHLCPGFLLLFGWDEQRRVTLRISLLSVVRVLNANIGVTKRRRLFGRRRRVFGPPPGGHAAPVPALPAVYQGANVGQRAERKIVDHACSVYSSVPDTVKPNVNHADIQAIFCVPATFNALSFLSVIPTVGVLVLGSHMTLCGGFLVRRANLLTGTPKGVPEGEWFCPTCCCAVCDDLLCYQCERLHHAHCKTGREMDHPGENCCLTCEKMQWRLQRLLGKRILVGQGGLSWTLVKPMQYDAEDQEHCDMVTGDENDSKLSVGLEVMHECFEPVEDVVFCKGSNLDTLNFKGFYTVLLERNEEMIATALLRIYGEKVAEVPLIGTRVQYCRLGMCCVLMNETEKNLLNLGVQKLVLPAAPIVVNTSFGFSIIEESDRPQYLGYPLSLQIKEGLNAIKVFSSSTF